MYQAFKNSKTLNKVFWYAIIIATFAILLAVCVVFQYRASAAGTGQQIANKATELAWGEGQNSSSPTPAFTSAANALGLDANNDCLRFVQTVIRASGVDDEFPIGNYGHGGGGVDEYSTANYMNSSNKWSKINTTNEADLQAGDILVSAINGSGNNHIFIYLGNDKVASANQGIHYGRVGNLSNEWCSEWGGNTPFQCVNNPFQVFRLGGSDSSGNSSGNSGNADAKLSDKYVGIFSQNNIYGWNPNECTLKNSSGNLKGTGNWDMIMKAKNADKSFFNGSGNVPSAAWSDTNKESLKTVLETYGDLAYQLGRVIGAPWVAILVQMRYEDSQSRCGANNFWGNGCPVSRAYPGGATIQGKNLGEGFTQYGKTLTEYQDGTFYAPALGISDPKKYLETLGPLWVQGDPNGPGYGSIEGEKASIDVVMDYITNGEGKSIVEGFTEYSGIDYGGASSSSSSSSSSTSTPPTGDKITWIGDSYSVGAHSIIEEKFSGISFGNGIGNPESYIQSNKGVSDRYGGGDGNPPALTILKRIADAGELKPYLVMAVGTNAGWTDEEVEEFKNIMSSHSDTKVVFVTAKAKAHLMSDDNGTNERLKALADSNNNYYLADWAAAYDDKYFADDSTHPNANGGYEKWVEIISNALASTNNCTTYEGEYPQYTQQTDYTCGQASMAMLATVAAGKDVSESDVIEITGGDPNAYANTIGSGMTALDKMVGDKYGFEVVDVPVNANDKQDVISKMKQYLNDGYMLHFSGEGSSCPYPIGAHYIGIFSLNGDTAKIANSGFAGQCSTEMNLSDIVNAGYHGSSFAAIKGKGSKTTCDSDICGTDGSGGLKSGGFTSVEEVEKVIMDPYRELANDPSQWGKYHLTSDQGPYNCFSFSNYFITKYTSIDFQGVPGVDGGGYAEEFYNIYHGQYPEITLSDKPTPYSVAGCGAKYYAGDGSPSHTFIVLGVDASKNTMIYGQAAYGSGAAGIRAAEISLDASDPYHVGSGCQYADFSKYLKGI